MTLRFAAIILGALALAALLFSVASAQTPAGPPFVDAEKIDDPKFRQLMRDIENLHEGIEAMTPGGREALELLRTPPPRSAAELTVLLFAEGGRWSVRYAEHEGLTAPPDAVMLPEGAAIELRPVAADLIYDMRFPALGLSFDAVPGRIGAVELAAAKPGEYRGDCELCGKSGAPLTLKIVPRPAFEAWLRDQAARKPE